MRELLWTTPNAQPSLHVRLVLESFDSAEECSLLHWQEVCMLVEEVDSTDEMNGTGRNGKLESAAWN